VALDHVTDLLSAFAERDNERFDLAIENVDQRVLAAVGEFFSYLNRQMDDRHHLGERAPQRQQTGKFCGTTAPKSFRGSGSR